MLQSTEVSFEAGTILSAEMLKELYEYPRFVLRPRYQGYGDGLLAGLDYEEKDGKVYLTDGVVKHQERYYFLREKICLNDFCKQQIAGKQVTDWCLGLNVGQESVKSGVKRQKLELRCVKQSESCELLLQLGRFCTDSSEFKLPRLLKEGKEPFSEYRSRNCLQLLTVPFSCFGGTTFVPYVFRAVRRFLAGKQEKSNADYWLLALLQNQSVVSLDTVRLYLEAREEKAFDTDDREKLFGQFTKALLKPAAGIDNIGNAHRPEEEVTKTKVIRRVGEGRIIP